MGLFDLDGFEEMMIMGMAMEDQKLADAGLDIEDLESMSEYERNEALEDAGLDPDDFMFL